jgi:hypothetical protein
MRTLRLRVYCAASLALFLAIAPWTGTDTCQAAELDIDNVMERMLAEKGDFDPKVLHEAGVDGLKQLFDKLFPQLQEAVGKALSPEEAAGLVVQLGAEKFLHRKAATEKLSGEAGEVGRPLVEKAARDEDPEVNFRAKKVLAVWAERNRARNQVNYSNYRRALEKYLACKHDESVLIEMAKLTRRVLECGPLRQGQRELRHFVLRAVTRSGKDKITDLLTPLLKHPSDSIATWVTESVCVRIDIEYVPRLLLEALKSDRECVVMAALYRVVLVGSADQAKAPTVKKLTTAIFNGDNEKLKLQSCYPMAYCYREQEAYDYLLAQTKSEDASRAYRALSLLASVASSWKMTPEFLAHVGPLLQSKDRNVRKCAVYALCVYKGAQIVDLLIPSLGDPDERTRIEVQRWLPRQTDRKMLKEKLAAAIKDSKNEILVKDAKAVLEKLGAD